MQNALVLDCLVVGAGQCGLMMGYLLQQAGFSYQIVDKAPQCGGSWHKRPPSLLLFTPRRFSGLSPMPMPGNPDAYPNSREMAQYLMAYANQAELNVMLGCGVQAVSQNPDGFFKVQLQGQASPIYAKTVVNAAGSNQVLKVPKWATQLPARVPQLRAEDWEQVFMLPRGANVLVVGDGAWGRLVAYELANYAQVFLACGKKTRLSPRRLFGRSIFCWLDWLGILRADKQSWVGQFLRRYEPIPLAHANNRVLQRMGVKVQGRAVGAEPSGHVLLAGHKKQHLKQAVDAVVWCGGYRQENTWLQLPVPCDDLLLQGRGRCTEVPGLFALGRKWLTCKASELILGVENDARLVLSYVHEHVQQMPAQPDLHHLEHETKMEYDHA